MARHMLNDSNNPIINFYKEKKMKKLIFAVIACALVAGPAMADDFAAMQTEKLDKIATKMEQFKNNPKVVEFLTEKKDCVTKCPCQTLS